MSWNQVVKKIINGDQVSAEEINPILAALVDRDQYLFDQIGQYESKSVLYGYNLLVNSDSPVVAGDVAYYKIGAGLTPAKVGFGADVNTTHFTPIQDSFAFGIVKEVVAVDGQSIATVYLHGLVDGINLGAMLNGGESVLPGPLYLSNSEAGKLTRFPGGLTVFIGYAINSTQLLLHPNYDSLNQLFFNYKFDLVDRPAGIPKLTSGTWTVEFPDVTKLGWISVADCPYPSLAPSGAVFYYNIPEETNLLADVSLSETEIANATALRHALPPWPHHFTTVHINGVLQHTVDADHPDGSYVINRAGLWWFKNSDESQPWASDLRSSSQVTFDTNANTVGLTAHGLVNGTKVSFQSSNGVMPVNLAVNTVYYVRDADTNTFKLAATNGGSALTVGSLTGSPVILLSWLSNKGSAQLRPKQQLNFVKLNPDYKTAAVSSIQPFDDNTVKTSKVLRFLSADDRLSEKQTGDLLAKFQIINNLTTENPVTNKAIKSVSFNNLTGELVVKQAPVVTGLNYTEGLTAVAGPDGVWTLSLANFTAAGLVEDIEPEDCDYLYRGLHSYLRLKNPASTARTGFVGKVRLPASLPTGKNFKLKLLWFGTTTSSNAAKFKFEYSVSAPGSISDTVTRTNNGGDISAAGFTAYTAAWVTNTSFEVPASALQAEGFVNFRLSRVYSADYTGDIGVLGVAWAIE
ncbi:MAG: hypothetical protein EBU46_06765 [Nitrosomonadaceae bacterium]|nr:hypothetical protein [Nitrosomonadaceae bacterium]